MKRTLCLILTLILAASLAPRAWAQYDIVWDGGPAGTGTSWNVAGNWNPDTVPTILDEAAFTNTGLSAGKIISLDADQGVATLTISTATVFTIGAAADKTAGNTLTLTDLTRSDVAGTEGIQTLAADVVLNGSSTWNVAGNNYLAVTGSISGAYPLTKTGTGELRMGANGYTGDTTILEGTLRSTAANTILGNLIIGSSTGVSSAAFTSTGNFSSIASNRTVTVHGNGSITFGGGYQTVNNLVVIGGYANVNYGGVTTAITLTGGTIGGGSIAGNHSSITTNASSSTAVISAYNSMYNYNTFTVADGPANIDLRVTGVITSNTYNSNLAGLTKAGAGLMSLEAANTYSGTTTINAGTLLASNTAGSATGKSPVKVAGGATLGGTGILGGLSGYTNANVALAGSSTASLATLAPGSVDPTTGSHVIGTLTIGGAAQSNTASFGNYSQLKLTLGNTGTGDKLAVFGDLNLASAGGSDQLTLATSSGAMVSGTYSLATFSGTLTGRFDTVTLNSSTAFPAGYGLQYRNGSNQVVTGTDDIANGSIVLTVEAGGWTTVPLGGGGYVVGFASDPAGNDIYCRSDNGGVFRWNAANGGWDSVTDLIVSPTNVESEHLANIASIAVDPNNANQLYVAAGDYPWAELHGIFSSSDRGATWTQINSTIAMHGQGAARPCGERLQVDPNNSNLLWFGSTEAGLQKGVRTGGTWTWTQIPSTSVPFGQVSSGDKYGVTFVACDKNGGSTIVYAGVLDNVGTTGGVYMSTDGGTVWSKVSGVAVTRPKRGEVAANGTLYVTHPSLVAKMTRGGALVAVTPTSDSGISYHGLAVAKSDASGNTVYVAEGNGSISYNKIWRTTDGGVTWARQSTNFNSGNYARMEPDGTPCLVGGWFNNIGALLANPANANELWAGDFYGVARTQNAQNLGTSSGAFWYLLQKGQDQTCVMDLKSPPAGGAPLLVGFADVGGFRYLDLANRPYGSYGSTLRNPGGGSTCSLDFCENNPAVWARAWDNSGGVEGSGGVSTDGGVSWVRFGQIAGSTVTNSSSAGWENWDTGAYLAQEKSKGHNTVTLALCTDNIPNYGTNALYFDSREAADTALKPKLVVNGSTTLTTTADSYVFGGTSSANYGTSTALLASYMYGQTAYSRWIYLKFDLSSVGSISSATLQLHRMASTNTIQFPVGIYACTDTSWGESAITWANRPKLLASYGGDPIGDPRYYDMSSTTSLSGGRIAVSSTNPNAFVWLPEGTSKAPRYSTDRGVTWTACTGAPTSQMTSRFAPSALINQLAADRVNGKFYLAKFSAAGGTHYIYSSTNGGANWAFTGSIAFTGGSWNTYRVQLKAAPAANDLWVCDDGVSGTTNGGLWHSTDGGVTWGARLTGIRAVRVVGFGKGPSGSGYSVFFYGYKDGMSGVYRSDDYGVTWTRLGTVPTVARVDAITGDRQNYGRVFIGTGGRGVFVGF